MNIPLRVGIAGYGVVGKRRHDFIDRNPLFNTVAVSDTKLQPGVSEGGLRTYASADEMLQEDLDAIGIKDESTALNLEQIQSHLLVDQEHLI